MKSTGEDQRAGGQGSRANAAALTLHVISRSCPSFPPVLLAHLLTLAPHFEASALYVPTVITMPWGWAVAGIQILGGALVGTSLLEFAARLPISHAVYRFAFGAGTTAVFATLFGMQAFYSRYGLYPGVRLLRDLWDSPAIVAVSVSTILSRTSLLSLLCLSAALCTLSWLAVSRARRTSRGLMQCAAMLLAGSLALWLPHEIWRAPQLGTTRLLGMSQ